MGTDLFFDPERVREAKAVCRDCPARINCLDGAYSRREQFGVWGGKTPEERGQTDSQKKAEAARLRYRKGKFKTVKVNNPS